MVSLLQFQRCGYKYVSLLQFQNCCYKYVSPLQQLQSYSCKCVAANCMFAAATNVRFSEAALLLIMLFRSPAEHSGGH